MATKTVKKSEDNSLCLLINESEEKTISGLMPKSDMKAFIENNLSDYIDGPDEVNSLKIYKVMCCGLYVDSNNLYSLKGDSED